MQIHVLELGLGNEPPKVELLQIGMKTSQDEKKDGHESTLNRVESFNHHNMDTHPSTPSSLPSTPRSLSSSSSFQSSTPRSLSSSSTMFCPIHRHSYSSGSSPTTIPPITLRGRLAYNGTAYLTLQIRRQVNPYVTTRGLVGRLGRSHHASAGLGDKIEAELWVRISEIELECELEVTFTPPEKRSNTTTTPTTAPTPLMSDSTLIPPSSMTSASTRSSSHTPIGTPSPSPSSTRIRRTHTPGPMTAPGLSLTPRPSPSTTSVPSSLSSSFQCTCPNPPSSATLLHPSLIPPPAPGIVSVTLSSNPLRHIEITSSLDGSPAGAKLRSTFEAQISKGLAGVIGKKIDIPLPTMK